MADQNTGFMLDSKEEIDQRGGSMTPLEGEDYIIKLAKVDLVQKPGYVNGHWDYSKLDWVFECLCIVHSLKAGGEMKDVDGGNVEPFSRYLFREVNPKSTGFMPDQVTPSFLRAVIAYMEGTQINDRIQAPNFVLLDSSNKVVEDEALRKQFLEAVQKGEAMNGYTGIPDIRGYEGRYIGSAVEVKVKGDKKTNKISKFSKLPANFVMPEKGVEDAAMENFTKYYTEKVLPRRDKRMSDGLVSAGSAPSPQQSQSAEDLGEVKMDDVAL